MKKLLQKPSKSTKSVLTIASRLPTRLESLKRLPTVLSREDSPDYYVTTDAIVTFTAAYFNDFPSDDQFDFIEARVKPWLEQTEALNLRWRGTRDTSVAQLIQALLTTVGTASRPGTGYWTEAAAGMVLLMWAEMTQSRTEHVV